MFAWLGERVHRLRAADPRDRLHREAGRARLRRSPGSPRRSSAAARKPISTVSDRSCAISSAFGGATLTTTSARVHARRGRRPCVAPASSYWLVGDQRAGAGAALDDDLVPALSPRRLSLRTTSGTSATRRSPSAVSLGTPICMRARRLPSCDQPMPIGASASAVGMPASAASASRPSRRRRAGAAAARRRGAPRACGAASAVVARRGASARRGGARPRGTATGASGSGLPRERHQRLRRDPDRRLVARARVPDVAVGRDQRAAGTRAATARRGAARRVDAGREQALDRQRRRLGVRAGARLAREAAVAVLLAAR